MKKGNLNRQELVEIVNAYLTENSSWCSHPKLIEVDESIKSIAKAGIDLLVPQKDQKIIKYSALLLLILVIGYFIPWSSILIVY